MKSSIVVVSLFLVGSWPSGAVASSTSSELLRGEPGRIGRARLVRSGCLVR